MTRWEYKVVAVESSVTAKKKMVALVEELNVLGAVGWELVALSAYSQLGTGGGHLLMKRPLE